MDELRISMAITEVDIGLPPGQDLLPDLAIFAHSTAQHAVLVSHGQRTSLRHSTRAVCFEQTSNERRALSRHQVANAGGVATHRHPAPLGAWASLARSAPGSRSPSAVRSKQSNSRPSGLATVTAQADRCCTHPWVQSLPVRRFGHGLSKNHFRMCVRTTMRWSSRAQS